MLDDAHRPAAQQAASPYPVQSEGPVISIASVAPLLKRQFWTIAAAVLAAVVVAAIYLASAPRLYVASAELMIEPAKQADAWQGSSSLAPTIDSAEVDSQLAVLRSDRIAGDVIDRLGLLRDTEFRSAAAGSDYALQRIAIERLKNALNVSRVGQSYVLEVSFRSTDPQKAARIANAAAAAYIRDLQRAKTQTAQQASIWLQDRVTALSADLNAAAAAVQKFRAENGIVNLDTKNQSRLIDKLTALEAKAEAFKKLYESSIQRLTEDRQQETYPVTIARVISDAAPPLAKSYPKSKLILLLAVLVGLIGGIAIVAVRSMLDGTVRDASQLRGATGLDCLATVPRAQPQREGNSAGLSDDDAADSFGGFAEAAQRIKLFAQRAGEVERGLCFGIASLLSGEGKTTLAEALAAALTESGCKTLIVDACWREPTLSRRLAPRAESGLLEALRDGAQASVAFDPATSAYLLPLVGGRRAVAAAGLLEGAAMQRLLRELRRDFAAIVVDLPSLRSGVEALAIAPLLDRCVVVTEWGHTPLADLERAVEDLCAAGAPLLGSVINKIESGIPPLFGFRLADLLARDRAGYVDRLMQAVSR